jgi:hypothetical protein
MQGDIFDLQTRATLAKFCRPVARADGAQIRK